MIFIMTLLYQMVNIYQKSWKWSILNIATPIPFATAIDQSMYIITYLRSYFVKYKNRDTIIKPQIKVIFKFIEQWGCKIIVQLFEKLAKILPFWILQKFVGIILSRVLCNWLLPRVLFSCVFRAFGKWFLLSCCKITRVTRRY